MKKFLAFLTIMTVVMLLCVPAVHAQSKSLKVFEFPLDSGCVNTFLTYDAVTVRVVAEQEYDDVKPTGCYPAPEVVVEKVVVKEVVKEVTPVVVPVVIPVIEPCPTQEFIVHFDFDKSEIKPDGNFTIDTLIDYLKGCQKEADIIVAEGHCDSRGSDNYNYDLGMRRAQAVTDALIDLGIDKNKIELMSKGESEVTGDHEYDRRVTITVNP